MLGFSHREGRAFLTAFFCFLCFAFLFWVCLCPRREDRAFHGLLHGHDEIAGFFEDMGLYGGGQRTKSRQSDLNVLMDKGRPSKIFRDHEKGYGKDLYALYKQTRDGRAPPKVQLLQISGINARDADKILRDDDVIAASLATRERYLFFTAPVMNPCLGFGCWDGC